MSRIMVAFRHGGGCEGDDSLYGSEIEDCQPKFVVGVCPWYT